MSGHVSICPNHQNGRVTPIKSRMDMAAKTNDCYPIVKFKGLDEKMSYEIEGMGVYSGKVLMNVGLKFPNDLNDFETICFNIKVVE